MSSRWGSAAETIAVVYRTAPANWVLAAHLAMKGERANIFSGAK